MAALCDFIEIYENNLDPESCEYLISLFESHSNNNIYNLTDNINISSDINNIHQQLLRIVINTRNNYYEKFCGRVFPESHAFEKFNISKFDIDSESSTNIDVMSYENARRFLCFTWFLNNNSGGQINFLDLTIQPEQGKLIVYPPFWMFPHKNNSPVDTSQYILTTYLHYK